MRSQKTKKEKKLNILLNAFKNQDSLSVKEIKELLTCSRKSAYNYIDSLKQHGYTINSQIIQNQAFYSLEKYTSQETETLPYLPITANILRKYTIIQELQKEPIEQKDFRKKMGYLPEKEQYLNDYRGRLLDVGMTYFYKLVTQLIDDKDIVFEQKEQKYYLSGANIPLVLSVDADKLYDMHDLLSNVIPGHPYYRQLRSLYQKLELLIGNPNEDMPFSDHYLTYGRKYICFDRINEQLAELSKFNYQSRILQIDYQTKKQKEISVLFATGMIVYCLEKDSLYLLGKSIDPKSRQTNFSCTVININRIKSISGTELKHSCYHSNYFKSVFDDMFSISADPPVRVKVEFECFGNIEQKLNQLALQRKNAEISRNSKSNTFIYTDFISGLPDFANYLRQFGKSIHVIEPLELKELMNFTVTRSLERYNEKPCKEVQ